MRGEVARPRCRTEQAVACQAPGVHLAVHRQQPKVFVLSLTRRARGVDLTPAGRAFLDHARSVLSQVEAASEAARRVAGPAKPCFAMGFLTGHELTRMPEALRILRDELPNIAAAPGENGTCGVKNYVKRVGCIFQTTKSSRDIDRAVFYCSTLLGRGIQLGALSQQRTLAKITEQYRREPPPAKALRLPRICVWKTSHPISTRGGLQRARRKRAASARQILLSSRNESRRQSPQNKWRDAVYASASRRDGESSLPSK